MPHGFIPLLRVSLRGLRGFALASAFVLARNVLVAASLLLLLRLIPGCACHSSNPRFFPEMDEPLRTMAVGVGEDYPVESWSMEIARRDMRVMQRAGVKQLRVALAWDHIEPQPGQFEWHFWDAFVDEAQSRGIALLPYVCYTPRWNAAGTADYWRQPPRDLAAFGRFVSAAATRYRGRIHSWELWNEPDNPDYWAATAAEYAQLVRAGSAAVRGADPSAKVVLGGISWKVSFLRDLFREEKISDAVDVVNLHSYYETWIPDPLEHLTEYIGNAEDIIARYGNHQTIWVAEIGYSDYHNGRDVSHDYRSRFSYEHTAQYQAEDLFRALTLLRATDAVALATWYRINDLPTTEVVIGDVNNRHLGLVTATGAEKPAFASLRFFVALLGGPLREIDRSCWIRRLAGSDAQIHCFQRPDGDVIAVIWLTTDVAGLQSGNGVDRRCEQIDLTVPFRAVAACQCDLSTMKWRSVHLCDNRGDTIATVFDLRGGETRLLWIRRNREFLGADCLGSSK